MTKTLFDGEKLSSELKRIKKSVNWLSVEMYAHDFPTSISTINNWVQGESDPGFSKVVILSRVLKKEIDFFVNG